MKCGNCNRKDSEGCADINCPKLAELDDINNKSDNDIGILDETDSIQENGGETEDLQDLPLD